ncbi:MAG: hypothetical protein ABSB63_17715 [Spirochaetia bacterium]|jgi:hypothetical protein
MLQKCSFIDDPKSPPVRLGCRVKVLAVIVVASMELLKVAVILAVTGTFPLPSAGVVVNTVGGMPGAQPAARTSSGHSKSHGLPAGLEVSIYLDVPGFPAISSECARREILPSRAR